MAERRMFAKTIIDSDAFLEMPLTSQLLYFHLSMRADDEGFINKPKSIMRQTGCKEDDMRVLATRKFIIPFESGVVVIKHWKIHNYIRGDRLHETKYLEEKSLLELDKNLSYTICQTNVRQLSDTLDTEVRIGKDRLSQDRNVEDVTSQFIPPSVENVIGYCNECGYKIDAERFIYFYASKGWMVGKNKMRDWKAAVRNWTKQDMKSTYNNVVSNKFHNFQQREYDFDKLERELLGNG